MNALQPQWRREGHSGSETQVKYSRSYKGLQQNLAGFGQERNSDFRENIADIMELIE
ncbi:hypothetical protein [Coleofasciculus sp. FACHB-1120]|uniref:hypothetical protein n=1 Tax=Coleofasciculus sp. FACHB-1120 TaxID=2692783 RepID=UPI00168730CC|nr:hypothetical protein [Coleofasciculus sp. FACHB-1120]MBD2744994.1 hypothetical protein [Coleofasciculus sp. FACHB-1120]